MPAHSIYQEHAPLAGLAEDVECFWTEHSCGSNVAVADDESQTHRVLPDGCADIIFDLTADSAQVVGAMTQAIVVPVDGHQLLSVRFRPGAASRYLSIALNEITDASIPLRDFWRDGQNVTDQIAESNHSSPQAALEQLARLLIMRRQAGAARSMKANPAVRSIIRELALTPTAAPVEKLARDYAISRQHLARQFKQLVGISPKQFQRVMRMQRLVEIAQARMNIEPQPGDARWAHLALDSGYFDQAHMIADFKDLCGVTPAAYFGQ